MSLKKPLSLDRGYIADADGDDVGSGVHHRHGVQIVRELNAFDELRDALEGLLESSMRTPAWLEEKHGTPFQLIVEAAAEKALVALEKAKVKS